MKNSVSPSGRPCIWFRWGTYKLIFRAFAAAWRSRNEITVAESEPRFRSLIDRNNAIILQIDPASGRILDANASACRFYGWTHLELCAMSIQDINQSNPAAVAGDLDAARLETRNNFVFAHRLANGDIKSVEVHSTAIEAGGQTLLVSIIHDITERLHYEKHVFDLIQLQKAILNSRVVGIIKIEGRQFQWTNAVFAEMLGYTQDALRGQPTRIIYPSDQAHRAFADLAYPVIQKGGIYRGELQCLCKDGSQRWFEISGSQLEQAVETSVWAFVDITERKMVALALQKSEELKRAILDSVSAEIAVVDGQGVILAVNEHWRNFALNNGVEPGSAVAHTGVGTNYLSVCQAGDDATAAVAQASRDGIRAVLDGVLPSFRQDYPCHSPGQERWFTMNVTPLAHGAHEGAVITHTDNTQRRQMEERVRQLAFHDSLTQLPNRLLFNDRLAQSMATSKRMGFYGALIFLDLDNFKPLNDLHGHDAGDLLLIEVAHRLKSCVREMDTVARFGGDEFVVMLSELDADKAVSTMQAATIAEKIRGSLSQPYQLTWQPAGKAPSLFEHRCSASIGVTLFIGQEASQKDILKWADLAMYEAKSAGRNQVRFYATNA